MIDAVITVLVYIGGWAAYARFAARIMIGTAVRHPDYGFLHESMKKAAQSKKIAEIRVAAARIATGWGVLWPFIMALCAVAVVPAAVVCGVWALAEHAYPVTIEERMAELPDLRESKETD